MAGPTKTLAQPTDRLQGLNYYSTHVKHYKVRWNAAECYCKSDEKLLKLKSYQQCKILLTSHYSISHNGMQQSSGTVRVQQLPTNGNHDKTLSLNETLAKNLLTAMAKLLLHTSKQFKVEVP